MDKCEEKPLKPMIPGKPTLPKKRRGRPPKYPDVWGKAYTLQVQAKERDGQVMKEPCTNTQPVLPSPVPSNGSSDHSNPPALQYLDQATFQCEKSDEFVGLYSSGDPEKCKKRAGRPRGSLNKRCADDGCGFVDGRPAGVVVTEEELLRQYYEAGGRDVKNFPSWVQETYQGRAHPIKIARMQNDDDPKALSQPTVVIVENEGQPPEDSSPPVTPRLHTLLQQLHRPIIPPPLQPQPNLHGIPVQRPCDTNSTSATSPAMQKCGVVKPSCLIANNDVALDLSVSSSGTKKMSSTTHMVDNTSHGTSQYKRAEMWSVDEVCQFVAEVANCEPYAQVFKEHVIDGQLLLELSESQMMNHLNMKLGPAMHLRRAIEKLRKTADLIL